VASKKVVWGTIVAVVTGAGAIGGALGIIPYVSAIGTWLHDRWGGYVQLSGSYPGEKWKPAMPAQFAWLTDQWCYPTLPGFSSQFRITNGTLQRQNQSTPPDPFVSDWVTVDVFISNRNTIRLKYENPDWPGSFIDFDPSKSAEWKENARYTDDQGVVTSGDKHLVLSCKRCRLTRGGLTYSCNPD